MVKFMLKNFRGITDQSGNVQQVCDVIESSPQYRTPREVENMQGIDVASAQAWIDQMNDWDDNWVPGF